MLQHVIETQVLDQVLAGVDFLVGIFKVGLDDKGRRIAVLAGGSVIRARVAALGQRVRDVAVSFDDGLDELGQRGVDEVRNHADGFGLAVRQRLLHVARHVLLDHGLDLRSFLGVGLEYRLAAQQPALLGGVPVELDGVLGRAVDDGGRLQKRRQGLEDRHRPAAVVVGPRRRQDRWQEHIDAVQVRSDHHRVVCPAWEARDDARLRPRVPERVQLGPVLERPGLLHHLFDLTVQP